MPNHASATLIGHIGRDPETRRTQGGTDIVTTTLAVSTGYGNNKKTTWWNVVAFGKTGESVEKFLKRGDAAGFVGEPSLREYEDKSGTKRQSLELTVQSIILLGGKDDAEPRKAAPVKKLAPTDGMFEDDETIPF